jgi:hypothetical protein
MALSGTSLTVTTLTTAGLLTNNTSGQVSSVTGSTLAALLGGAPTFTGLTLSGLGTGILKVTAGVISLASAGTDYQTPISAGNNMAFTGSAIGTVTTPSFTGLTLSGLATGILKVTAGVVSIAPTSDYQYLQGSNITISGGTISTSATPSFTGLTLSGLSTGLLKVTAGVVGLAAAGTDYLSALTAGTNITITNNTIATTTLPTFAGINCSSVGNQNTLCGTNAGINLLSNGSGGNTFIGFQTGMNCTAGGLNMSIGNGSMSNGATGLTGQGFNMAIGTASLYNLAGTASHNIGIGYLTGFNLTTGSSNVYIGDMANASSGTVSNEGVINLSGSSTAGRGANTMLINASAGIFGGARVPTVSGSTITPLSTPGRGNFITLFNGVILMWFSVAVSWSNASTNVLNWTFPVSFPNGAFFVSCAMNSTSSGAVTNQYSALTTSSVTIYLYNNFNGAQSGTAILWAIGC